MNVKPYDNKPLQGIAPPVLHLQINALKYKYPSSLQPFGLYFSQSTSLSLSVSKSLPISPSLSSSLYQALTLKHLLSSLLRTLSSSPTRVELQYTNNEQIKTIQSLEY